MALNVGELVATLTIEDDRFQRSLTEDQRRMNTFEQAVRQATGRVDSSFRDSTQSVERLGTSATDASRDLGRVGQSATDVARVGTEARQSERQVQQLGDAGQRTARQMDQIGDGLQDRLEGAFEGAEDVAGRSGGAGGGNFLAGFTSKLGDLGGKGGPIAGALLGVAAVGLAAGKVLADAIADGMAVEAASDQIQANLGIDEATMRNIAEASGAAYGNVFGESVAANMSSAQDLFDFGLVDTSSTADEIQNAIEKVATLNSMLGEETPETLRGVSGLVRSGLAQDVNEAADLIAQARNKGVNAQGDLIDSLSEYSAGWEQTGFSAKFSLALIDQMMENGVDNADRGSDAIREFGRRMSENADDQKAVYSEIGEDAEAMYDIFIKGGPDAEAAFDRVADGISKIEDPARRAVLWQQLLGDTAGDFIGAFDKMDPSVAVEKFGQVEDASKRAADTMASNTQAKFDQAQRAVELSMSGIKLAVADGFGPSLDKFADWVNTHQPEILGFFVETGDAVFATLDAFLAFAEGSLRAGAMVADGFASTFGEILGLAGHVGETFGGILKHIPGMQSAGETLEDVGRAAQNYSEGAHNAADKSRELADLIDGELRPGIQNARDDFAQAGEAAQLTAEMTRALGNEVEAVPDGKDIIINSNSPEQTAALEDLGLTVETLPDGKFKVTSNTAEGQEAIDAFIRANSDKSIDMFVRLEQRRVGYWTSLGASPEDAGAIQGPVPVVPNADGNVYEQHDPQIGDGRTARVWNEPETQGESYIPHAPSKRPRAEKILAVTAEKFGLGLVRSFADGGIIDREGLDASMAWAKSVDPARYGMGGFSSDILDCSGAVSGAINKALGLDAFDSRMSTVNEGAWLQAKGAILGRGPEGTMRVGWWDEGGGANGHTALTYPDGTNFESNGSEGVVVGGPTGADDPSFTNQAWFPLSGDLGRESGSGTTGSDTASGQTGTVGVTDSGAVLSTDGTKVFVTNWPASMGGSDEKKPIFSAGLKVFANGGEDHSAQIGTGTSRLWNEPETGGEGYIPLSPAKRPRSVAITKQIANRFGYQLVPMADGGLTGFGGFQNDDRPTLDIPLDGRGMSSNKARASFHNLLALAAGGANALASGFDGDGNFTGKFDTGSNSPAVLEEGLGQLLDVLTEIKDAAQAKTPVDVKVDIDQGTRSANIAIMEAGL